MGQAIFYIYNKNNFISDSRDEWLIFKFKEILKLRYNLNCRIELQNKPLSYPGCYVFTISLAESGSDMGNIVIRSHSLHVCGRQHWETFSKAEPPSCGVHVCKQLTQAKSHTVVGSSGDSSMYKHLIKIISQINIQSPPSHNRPSPDYLASAIMNMLFE